MPFLQTKSITKTQYKTTVAASVMVAVGAVALFASVGMMATMSFLVPQSHDSIKLNKITPQNTQVPSPVLHDQRKDQDTFVSDSLILEFTNESMNGAIESKLNNDFILLGLTGISPLDALNIKYGVTDFSPVFKTQHKKKKIFGITSKKLIPFYQIKIKGDVLDAKEEFQQIPGINTQLVYNYTPDRVPLDPSYNQQYSHQRTDAEEGWDIETGDSRVVIAILGVGVDLDHPDLEDNIWINEDEIPNNNEDDDQNNFIDDISGWDFINNDNDPNPPNENSSHETEVAGVAAAVTNNDEGVAGVSWNSKIMPLRSSYTTIGMASAIDYARENGARVINMSFGNYSINRYGPDTVMERAVNEAFDNGIVLVATAGNDSIQQKRYPAALQNVIAVSSTDRFDQRSGFSNYGSWISVAAPGGSIFTTTVDGYALTSGTSFAAPYVAGLAALIISKSMNDPASPILTPNDVRLRIEYSVDKIDTDFFIGNGRINMQNALSLDTNPTLFAVIKSPNNNSLASGATQEVVGTVIGDSYILELKNEQSTEWTVVNSGSSVVDDVLGVINPDEFPAGTYIMRLTATFDGQIDQDQIRVFVEHFNADWSWPHHDLGVIVGSPSYSDIDGDGDAEIFIGTDNDGVYGWHHDGQPIDGWPARPDFALHLFGSPSIENINGDQWIIQGSYVPEGIIYRIAGNGWHTNGIYTEGYIRGATVLADLNEDGFSEIIAATTNIGEGGGKIHVLRANGRRESVLNWPVDHEGAQTTPAVGDIVGDENPEVIVLSDSWLSVYNHDGTQVRGAFPISLDSNHTSPALADLDGNGTIEIIALDSGTIEIYNGNGQRVSWRALRSPDFLYTHFCLGDIDSDGLVEIFIGDENGKMYGIDYQGNELSRFPVTAEGSIRGCVIGDIDGRHGQEIIAATSQGLLYAWDKNGQLLENWPKGVGGTILGSPAIGDLDNDGDIEVMVGTAEGSFVVFDLNDEANTERMDWPMLQGNAKHTGLLYDGIERPMPEIDLGPEFYRGNVDSNNEINADDVIYLLRSLFEGGPQSTCQDSADVNDDGFLGVDDAVRLVLYLSGQVELDAPGNTLGPDPTEDNLGCEIPHEQFDNQERLPLNAEVNADQCDIFEDLGFNAFEQQCEQFKEEPQIVHDNFIRGDANQDGTVDGADIQTMYDAIQNINTAQTLFIACQKAFDVDDNGVFSDNDPGYLLDFLFTGTRPQPNAPFPNAGQDQTPDGLTCTNYSQSITTKKSLPSPSPSASITPATPSRLPKASPKSSPSPSAS